MSSSDIYFNKETDFVQNPIPILQQTKSLITTNEFLLKDDPQHDKTSLSIMSYIQQYDVVIFFIIILLVLLYYI